MHICISLKPESACYFTGLWTGIKPTGKRIEVTGVNIDKIIDNKIVEHGGAANMFDGL